MYLQVDRRDVVVPLLTIATGLGVAGVLSVTASVSVPAAVAYGVFASALLLLATVVGLIGWALYVTIGGDSASSGRCIGRSGAA